MFFQVPKLCGILFIYFFLFPTLVVGDGCGVLFNNTVPKITNTTCTCDAGVLSNCNSSPAGIYLYFIYDISDTTSLKTPLTSISSATFDSLSLLQQLSLAYNQLSFLPEEIFFNLTSLTDLSLQYNRLTALPELIFSKLTALEVLTLNSNYLTEIVPKLFDSLTQLNWLSLQGNLLQSLPTNIFYLNFVNNSPMLFLNLNPWNCSSSTDQNTTCLVEILHNSPLVFQAVKNAFQKFGGANIIVDPDAGTYNQGVFCKTPIPSLITINSTCALPPSPPPPAPSNVTSLPHSFDIRIQSISSVPTVPSIVGFCTAVATVATTTISTTTTTTTTSTTTTSTQNKLCGFTSNYPAGTTYAYGTAPNNGDNPCGVHAKVCNDDSDKMCPSGRLPANWAVPNQQYFGPIFTCSDTEDCLQAENIGSNGQINSSFSNATPLCNGHCPSDTWGNSQTSCKGNFVYADTSSGCTQGPFLNVDTCLCAYYNSKVKTRCYGGPVPWSLWANRCGPKTSLAAAPAPKLCSNTTLFTSTAKDGKFSLTTEDFISVKNGTGFVNANHQIITNHVTAIGCDQNKCLYPELSTETAWQNFAYQQNSYIPPNTFETIILHELPVPPESTPECLRLSFSHAIQLVQFGVYQPSNQSEINVAHVPQPYISNVTSGRSFNITVRHPYLGIPLTVDVAYSLQTCDTPDSFTERNYISIKAQPVINYHNAIQQEKLCLLTPNPAADCVFKFQIPDLPTLHNYTVTVDIVKWPCTALYSSTYANNIPLQSLAENGMWSMLMYAGECINITGGQAFIHDAENDIPVFTVLDKNMTSIQWNLLNTSNQSYNTALPGFQTVFQTVRSQSAYLADESKKKRFFYTDSCYQFWQTRDAFNLFENPVYNVDSVDYIIDSCQFIMYKVQAPCAFYWTNTFLKIKDDDDAAGLLCYFFVSHVYREGSNDFNVFSLSESQPSNFQPIIYYRQAGLQLPLQLTNFQIAQPSYFHAVPATLLTTASTPLLFKNYFPNNKPFYKATYVTAGEAGVLLKPGQLAAVLLNSATIIRDPTQNEETLFFYPSAVSNNTQITLYLQNITSPSAFFIRPWNLWEYGNPMTFLKTV